MTRPVRPVALVILTACMVYPGLTMVFQGGYPFVSGEWFMMMGQTGFWANVLTKLGIPHIAVDVLKVLIGGAWLAGVPGLWAGDNRAYPLVLGAAVLTLFYSGGPTVMAVVALICLLFFRENADEVPA
jgi:hypothetical protein